jgi:hypothetical protein
LLNYSNAGHHYRLRCQALQEVLFASHQWPRLLLHIVLIIDSLAHILIEWVVNARVLRKGFLQRIFNIVQDLKRLLQALLLTHKSKHFLVEFALLLLHRWLEFESARWITDTLEEISRHILADILHSWNLIIDILNLLSNLGDLSRHQLLDLINSVSILRLSFNCVCNLADHLLKPLYFADECAWILSFPSSVTHSLLNISMYLLQLDLFTFKFSDKGHFSTSTLLRDLLLQLANAHLCMTAFFDRLRHLIVNFIYTVSHVA